MTSEDTQIQYPQEYLLDYAAPQPHSSAWIFYVIFWSLISASALAFYEFSGSHMNAGLACGIAVATVSLIGIAWKPQFGVGLLYGTLTVGALGTADISNFSISKGVAIVVTAGIILHMLGTRLRVHLREPNVIALLILTILSSMSIAWAWSSTMALSRSFTIVQLAVMTLLIVTICIELDLRSFRWILRFYVLGALLIVMILTVTGTIQADFADRLTLGAGVDESQLDPNMVGICFGMGFLMAVYLLFADKGMLWKMLWLLALVALPVAIIMTGSRTAVYGLLAVLVVPFLMPREIIRRPMVAVGILVVLGLLAVIAVLGFDQFFSAEIVKRMTNTSYAEDSYDKRYSFIVAALGYVSKHPLGAGMGCFNIGARHIVHNDLFYLISNLGWAGGALWGLFVIMIFSRIFRMKVSWEKWLARGLALYLIVCGLSFTQIMAKYFWFGMALATLLSILQRKERREQSLVENQLADTLPVQ